MRAGAQRALRGTADRRRAATGSGGTGTITRRTRIGSSTICSGGTCATCTVRSGSGACRIIFTDQHHDRPQTRRTAIRALTAPVTSTGRGTHYGEWSDVGRGAVGEAGGAMHRVAGLTWSRALRVGCRSDDRVFAAGRAPSWSAGCWRSRPRSSWWSNGPEPRLSRGRSADPLRWAAVGLVAIAARSPACGPNPATRIRLSVLVLDQRARSVERHPCSTVRPRDVIPAPQRRHWPFSSGPV